MAPLKSQNLPQKLSAGNTQQFESKLSGGKKKPSGRHYHFYHADCASIFQKNQTILTEAWQAAQRKGGRGGDGAILSAVTFSVPHYLLLFRAEWQLPTESSHALMHRKFLIVHPPKTMTFKYTEWYITCQLHCTGRGQRQKRNLFSNVKWFHIWNWL